MSSIKANSLDDLLGEVVTLLCVNYFYSGKLHSVCEEWAVLKNAVLIAQTGEPHEKEWRVKYELAPTWRVRLDAVESLGVWKNDL